MKIKFLSIAFAFVVALALASCDGKKDTTKMEATGDIDKDAKEFVEAVINLSENVKSADDYAKNEKEGKELKEKFEKYYKDKSPEDLKKFQDAVTKLAEGEYKEKLEKATENIKKFEEEAKKAASGAEEAAKKAAEDAGAGATE